MNKSIIITAICASSFFTIAKAQTYAASTQSTTPVTTTSRWNDYARSQYFGIRIGLAASTAWFNHFSGLDIDTGSKPGLSFGFMFGQQIAPADVPLFIELGLNYSQKGFSCKYEANDYFTSIKSPYSFKHKMQYIEVPLVIKYKIGNLIVDDLTIQPFLGGFLAFGIAGDTYIYEHPVRSKFKASTFGDNIFSRMDAGVRVGCGLAWQNLYLEAACDFGLMNICGDDLQLLYVNYQNFDESCHTGCFTISFGVDF